MYDYEIKLFNQYNGEDEEVNAPISERENKEFYDSLSDDVINWIAETGN